MNKDKTEFQSTPFFKFTRCVLSKVDSGLVYLVCYVLVHFEMLIILTLVTDKGLMKKVRFVPFQKYCSVSAHKTMAFTELVHPHFNPHWRDSELLQQQNDMGRSFLVFVCHILFFTKAF